MKRWCELPSAMAVDSQMRLQPHVAFLGLKLGVSGIVSPIRRRPMQASSRGSVKSEDWNNAQAAPTPRLRLEVTRPFLHYDPAPFQQVRPRVSCLNLVSNGVGKTRLSEFSCDSCITCPITE